MAEHQFESQKMVVNGLALNLTSDLRAPGKFHFLKNIRVLRDGEVRSRSKVDVAYTLNPALASVPHTVKILVDKILDKVNLIAGIDTEIYTGNTLISSVLNQKVSGFSGDPLSIVDFRPEEAVESHAYISDKQKMCKISTGDIVSDIGINAPTKSATVKIVKPVRKVIDNIKAADVGNWNNLTGSAGVPAAENRVDTTITAILYDEATPSWASIIPAAFPATLQAGCIVTLNGVDDLFIEETIPSSLLAGVATIETIVYDAGVAGLCTIILSIADPSIVKNSILLLGGSEYVRVQQVTRDENGVPSIRVSTVGTFAAGNTISGAASFRVYATNVYAATQAVFAEGLVTAVGAAGISSITRTFDVDLTHADGKELGDNDIVHCSLRTTNPAVLTEIQIQFGAPDFTDNYWYYAVTPNFFTSSATQSTSTLSTLQQAIQREEVIGRYYEYIRQYSDGTIIAPLLDSPEPIPIPDPLPPGPITETELGQNQYTELFIRLRDLKRVGSDPTRTKKDIKAIRISINCTAAISISLDSLWVGGSGAVDSPVDSGLLPYNYIWRIRDPKTKAHSNWSPPIRNNFRIMRGNTELSFPDADVDFPVEYMIDIARFGGTLNDYRIVGSIKNNGSTFIDNVSDFTAAQNDPAGRRLTGNQVGDEEVFDFYKPFAFLDVPKSGTCSIVGTKLTRLLGDNLDVSWSRGVPILIDGKLNRFFTNPTSANEVELEKDMGTLIDVPFEIAAPLLTGQPLPIIFGPFGEGVAGLFVFGLGNDKAAGTLYWLDGNSPDTQSDTNFREITSPSEPLLTGIMYDGYGFVYSNKRSFMIIPTFDSGGSGFIARENAGSRGIFSRWAICSNRNFIYYVTENGDGIVKVAGTGIPSYITDASINTLFIRNGIAPSFTILVDGTSVFAPDWTKEEEIRLFACKDTVIFRFTDIIGNEVALIYDERIDDWISYDTYLNNKVNSFYQEEIESSNKLLVGIEGAIGVFGDATNREDGITSMLIPFSHDTGNSRILKRYDEIVFDVDAGINGVITYTNIYNNGDIIDPADTILGLVAPIRRKVARVIEGGTGRLVRNITSKLEWKIEENIRIYEVQFYFLLRADQINDRASDEDDAGIFGDKFWQGFTIEADTFGEDKELRFFDDENNFKEAIVINHSGKSTKSYSFESPFIAHKVIQTSDDGIEWVIYNIKYKFDIEPELGKVWETQETSHGIPGFKVIERIGIVARTTAVATLKVFYDDAVEEYALDNTGGDKKKQFFFVKARKGKLLKYRVESASDFRIYMNDLEILIRQYNSPNFYQVIKPFGAEDYKTGAQI